jgi:hypothetical protein
VLDNRGTSNPHALHGFLKLSFSLDRPFHAKKLLLLASDAARVTKAGVGGSHLPRLRVLANALNRQVGNASIARVTLPEAREVNALVGGF